VTAFELDRTVSGEGLKMFCAVCRSIAVDDEDWQQI